MKSAAMFACLLWLSSLAVAQQDPESLVIGRKITLHSRVLNEERPCWVYLPASYEAAAGAGRSYPVVYLLDGRAHFNALQASSIT